MRSGNAESAEIAGMVFKYESFFTKIFSYFKG